VHHRRRRQIAERGLPQKQVAHAVNSRTKTVDVWRIYGYVGLQRGHLTAGEFFSAIGPMCDASNSVLRVSSKNVEQQ
jgi:hypothetical protein